MNIIIYATLLNNQLIEQETAVFQIEKNGIMGCKMKFHKYHARENNEIVLEKFDEEKDLQEKQEIENLKNELMLLQKIDKEQDLVIKQEIKDLGETLIVNKLIQQLIKLDDYINQKKDVYGLNNINTLIDIYNKTLLNAQDAHHKALMEDYEQQEIQFIQKQMNFHKRTNKEIKQAILKLNVNRQYEESGEKDDIEMNFSNNQINQGNDQDFHNINFDNNIIENLSEDQSINIENDSDIKNESDLKEETKSISTTNQEGSKQKSSATNQEESKPKQLQCSNIFEIDIFDNSFIDYSIDKKLYKCFYNKKTQEKFMEKLCKKNNLKYVKEAIMDEMDDLQLIETNNFNYKSDQELLDKEKYIKELCERHELKYSNNNISQNSETSNKYLIAGLAIAGTLIVYTLTKKK